ISAQHNLTINAGIAAGTSPIVLQADASGSGNGTLTLTASAAVTSSNQTSSGITLRGADMNLQPGSSVASSTSVAPFASSAVSYPSALAFDSAGNLYVANQGNGTVSQYSSTGTLINASYVSGLSGPTALAFDAAGNLYVAAGSGTVSQYSS